MDDIRKKALYQQMVSDKVVQHESGLIELPVKALQEYHDAIGLEPNQLCYFSLHLPDAEDGLYNYIIGDESDEDAAVVIMDVFYFDTETGESESLGHNKVLEASIYRRFYDGEAMINGSLMIDNLGRIWFYAMMEDNIGAEFCVQFSEGSRGYSICYADLTFCSQIWFDGEKVLYCPTLFFVLPGLPS